MTPWDDDGQLRREALLQVSVRLGVMLNQEGAVVVVVTHTCAGACDAASGGRSGHCIYLFFVSSRILGVTANTIRNRYKESKEIRNPFVTPDAHRANGSKIRQ